MSIISFFRDLPMCCVELAVEFVGFHKISGFIPFEHLPKCRSTSRSLRFIGVGSRWISRYQHHLGNYDFRGLLSFTRSGEFYCLYFNIITCVPRTDDCFIEKTLLVCGL